jgi:hypothetical protein
MSKCDNTHIDDIVEEAKIQNFFYRGREVARALDQNKDLPSFDSTDDLVYHAVVIAIDECADLISTWTGDQKLSDRLLAHFNLTREPTAVSDNMDPDGDNSRGQNVSD